jgi:hypothetical protein
MLQTKATHRGGFFSWYEFAISLIQEGRMLR